MQDRLRQLEAAQVAGATEAFLGRRDAVLDSLVNAEEAAHGNERLLELFGAIRETLSVSVARAAETEVPEAVREWRRQAADRYPELVTGSADGRQVLALSGDFRERPDDLARLMLELDKRTHSTRVAPVVDRAFYGRDLDAVIDAVVASGVLDEVAERQEPAAIAAALDRRSTLGSATWERWSTARQPGDTMDPSSLLGAAGGEGFAQAELVLQLKNASPAGAAELVDAVPDANLDETWEFIFTGLASDATRADALDREVRSQGAKAGREVSDRLDLPFKVIESLLLSYFRLRNRLSDAGWKPVEEQLGSRVTRGHLDAARHQVEGDPEAEEFEVVSLGIRMGSDVLHKAVVRGITADESSED